MIAMDKPVKIGDRGVVGGAAGTRPLADIKQGSEDALISMRPWNSIIYGIPPRVKKIPTMLTDEEGRMLRWIAEFDYQGVGAICELGTFVGGSTARLAYGLSLNKRSSSPIHCFDRYECAENMKPELLYKHGIEPFEGQDILPISKNMLKEFTDLLRFHKCNILDVRWADGPIEFLFIDIMKTVEISNHVGRTFFPHLIPGRSLLVQQDYFHFRNPWIVAQMELLRDHFDLLAYTESNSAIFRCVKEVTPDSLRETSWSNLSLDHRDQLLKEATRRFPYLRQREFIAECRRSARCNPNATAAWQIKLGPASRAVLDEHLVQIV